MKKNICLLFLILTACAPAASSSTATPELKLTSTSTPVASSTPVNTPTLDAISQTFNSLQEKGITVSHENGQWILGLSGMDVPNTFFDENREALHILTGEDQIDIPTSQVLDRVNVVDGVIVVKSEDESKLAAFDPSNVTESWGSRWFTKGEVMAVVETADNAITVGSTWLEFNEHMKLEKAFMEPFADDIYYPTNAQIFKDYENRSKPQEEIGNSLGFSWLDPFGRLAVGYDEFAKLKMEDKLPFKGVNCKLLAPNPEEGRNGWLVFITEQVFDPNNPNDIQAFQLADGDLKGPDDVKGKNGKSGVCGMATGINYGAYILPRYVSNAEFANIPRFKDIVEFYKKNGYWDKNNGLTGIGPLVQQWLQSGIVPEDLKKIPLTISVYNFW